jgi:hypothetical protein
LGGQEHGWIAVAEALLRQPGLDGAPGGRASLLLFIGDLQWADAASLWLFHFVAPRLGRGSVAPAPLIGVYRNGQTDDNLGLLSFIHDLGRLSWPIAPALPPPSAASVDAVIAQFWPERPLGYQLGEPGGPAPIAPPRDASRGHADHLRS